MRVPNIFPLFHHIAADVCAHKFWIVRNKFEPRASVCVCAFVLISCVGGDMSLL